MHYEHLALAHAMAQSLFTMVLSFLSPKSGGLLAYMPWNGTRTPNIGVPYDLLIFKQKRFSVPIELNVGLV